jgi:hypothetical protein
MFSWAVRRQLFYGGGILVFLLLVFGTPFLSRTLSGPLCTDGQKNGQEIGIDCGGACARLCVGTVQEPRVLWERAFNEGGGVGSALLYGENPNAAGVFSAPFYVKLYDSAGVLVAEKETVGSIVPGSTFAIFAPNLFVGARIPVRAVFEPRVAFEWRRDVPAVSVLAAHSVGFSLVPQPRVEAVIENRGAFRVGARAVAILFDRAGNALGASETIAEVPARSSVPTSFVWRVPFAVAPVRAEVLVASYALGAN